MDVQDFWRVSWWNLWVSPILVAKHTLTTWYWLLLPPETNHTLVYGAPIGTILGTFLAGILLVRTQRRK